MVTQNRLKWQTLQNQKKLCEFDFFAWGLTPLIIAYWYTQKREKTHLSSVFCWCHHQRNILKKYQLQISVPWDLMGMSTINTEAPHWQAPQIWPIASPNDKPGFLFRWLVVIQPLPGFKSAWSVEVFMMLYLKQTAFYTLHVFKGAKGHFSQNWGPSTAYERVFCDASTRGALPRKISRLANTPIQLAIGSHQPGTWIQ